MDNFIQISVCCSPKPRVGAFVYRNVERSIAKSLLKFMLCFVTVYVTKNSDIRNGLTSDLQSAV